jgi:hypothetical protein
VGIHVIASNSSVLEFDVEVLPYCQLSGAPCESPGCLHAPTTFHLSLQSFKHRSTDFIIYEIEAMTLDPSYLFHSCNFWAMI